MLKFHPEVIKKDLKLLDASTKKYLVKALDKIKENPKVWLLLKTPLGGYRKLYFWNKKYRIVYKIDGETVYVLAIGKRENKNVYDAALNRI